MLAYLAKQDKRYNIDKEYLSDRVRVSFDNLKTAQDDASVVFSIPTITKWGELPFVFSFKLVEGKLAPSPSKFAIQKIKTKDIMYVNEFEVFSDKILFTRC